MQKIVWTGKSWSWTYVLYKIHFRAVGVRNRVRGRCPGDDRSQGISNHHNDYVEPKWFGHRTLNVNFRLLDGRRYGPAMLCDISVQVGLWMPWWYFDLNYSYVQTVHSCWLVSLNFCVWEFIYTLYESYRVHPVHHIQIICILEQSKILGSILMALPTLQTRP